MRYFYEKKKIYLAKYGVVYKCDHVVYSECTLYSINDKGLGVIQQRYDPETKRTWWGAIDPWLVDDIYLNDKFFEFFKQRGGLCVDGLYPTVTVRQIMWALKMKPLKRERWETVFDRRDI